MLSAMSDRQPSEEPEEQVDLEGDDDGMDDDDAGYRRRGSRDDSEEPEEDDDNDERHGEADDDAGMEPEPAGSKGGDDTGKGPDVAGGGPEDEEERSKWDDMLALPPHGSEVFIGGLPRDITEEDLRELCEPLGEIYEVSFTRHTNPAVSSYHQLVTCMRVVMWVSVGVNGMAGEVDQG